MTEQEKKAWGEEAIVWAKAATFVQKGGVG